MITTSAILWIASLLAAVLSCVVSACKLIDRKRQRLVPALHEYKSVGDLLERLPTRRAPLLAGKSIERVAKFDDICDNIKTGDLISFSGRTLFGYAIRGFTYSDKSHVGLALVVDAANKELVAKILGVELEEGIYMIDSCEGMGVTIHPFRKDVNAYPGQYYWHETSKEFRYRYKREKVAIAALEAVRNNTKYGWAGIVLQFILHFPVLRTLAYALGFASCKRFTQRPFCSMGATNWVRTSSVDPIPHRDSQLIVPQELCQSMLFPEGIAIVP